MFCGLFTRIRSFPPSPWLAGFLFLAAVVLLISAAVPYPASRQKTRFPALELAPQSPADLRLPEKRMIVLDWPQKMRQNDSAFILLTLAMEEEGSLAATSTAGGQAGEARPVDDPGIYATYNLVAIGRLDLAGVGAFRGEIREPLAPGRETVFRWRIRAREAGTYRGVVWLHVDLVRKDGGGLEQVLLLARPIEIAVVPVFGLPADVARALGWAGLVLSTLLGYPFLQNWVKGLRRRRQEAVSKKEEIFQESGPE